MTFVARSFLGFASWFERSSARRRCASQSHLRAVLLTLLRGLCLREVSNFCSLHHRYRHSRPPVVFPTIPSYLGSASRQLLSFDFFAYTCSGALRLRFGRQSVSPPPVASLCAFLCTSPALAPERRLRLHVILLLRYASSSSTAPASPLLHFASFAFAFGSCAPRPLRPRLLRLLRFAFASPCGASSPALLGLCAARLRPLRLHSPGTAMTSYMATWCEAGEEAAEGTRRTRRSSSRPGAGVDKAKGAQAGRRLGRGRRCSKATCRPGGGTGLGGLGDTEDVTPASVRHTSPVCKPDARKQPGCQTSLRSRLPEATMADATPGGGTVRQRACAKVGNTKC